MTRTHGGGFTLIETLVACALCAALMALVLASLRPLHGLMLAEPERDDLHQRARLATDALGRALRGAGAGMLVGGTRGPIGRLVPAVFPYRVGEIRDDAAAGVRFRSSVFTTMRIPVTGAQATLREPAARGASTLTLDWPASCPPPGVVTVCGFGPGTHVLLFDRTGQWDLLTVASVVDSTVTLETAGGVSGLYPAGAALAEVEVHSFSLATDSTGMPRLFDYDGFRAEFPVVDHVTALQVDYFGEPRQPARLGASLSAPLGPWTTYGPAPPEPDVDVPDAWPTGENCVFTLSDGVHASRLPPLAPGSALVPIGRALLEDGPWCPDAGSRMSFDADLLRIRRIRIRIRVEAASDSLRAGGALFSRPGRSTSAERVVPDDTFIIDVTPPNLALGR